MRLTFRRALVIAAGMHVLASIAARVADAPSDEGAREVRLSPTTFTTELFAVELQDERHDDPATPASVAIDEASPRDETLAPSPQLAIATTPRPRPMPIEETTSETTAPSIKAPGKAPGEGPGEVGDIANAAPPSGTTTKGPYVVPELGKKSSWLLPPILPDAVGAAGTASPKSAEDQLAAKLSKDVTAMVDAKGKSKDGGAGGPVISAAHTAAHDDPLAPSTGIAVFEVKTDASGSVQSVTVLSTDGDGPGWNVVAATMKKGLANKKLVVPSGANGMKVTVRIQAKFALPSGATGSGVKPFVAGIGGGFGFDLSDIGQKPMRVVSVVELDESRL